MLPCACEAPVGVTAVLEQGPHLVPDAAAREAASGPACWPILVRAWGRDPEEVAAFLDRAAALTGLADDWPGFAASPEHRLIPAGIRAAFRTRPGLRLSSSGWIFRHAVSAVFEQKVTGAEAIGAWQRLTREHADPAPSPGRTAPVWARDLVLPLTPLQWRRIPSWHWRTAGVDAPRSAAVGRLAEAAGSLIRVEEARRAAAPVVEGGAVDGRAQHAAGGEHAAQHPRGLDDEGGLVVGRRDAGVDGGGLARGLLRRQRQELGAHHLVDGGEDVDAGELGRGHDPQRAALLVDHGDDAVRALVQQGEALADGAAGRERERMVHQDVPLLDRADSTRRSSARSCGRTARPPRRAITSAMRRPETAVMLAATIGIVVPVPSSEARSTSKRLVTAEREGRKKQSS